MSARVLRVATIAGDGIGPEVVEATIPLMRQAAAADVVKVAVTEMDWGGDRHLLEGAMMPADASDILRGHDAVLFGAVGHPELPPSTAVWGLILPLRQELELAINLRPVWSIPGVPTPLSDPDGIDFVVVRENSEGEYSGAGGVLHRGTPHEVATEVAVHTRVAIERTSRFAFALARDRGQTVSLVTKSNVQRFGYGLWDMVAGEIHAAEFPDVPFEQVFVDAMATRMVQRPRSLGVLLCGNLFGDVLSDLGAGLQGGLGLAPSANLSADGSSPGVFEPVHGSAPDIAGQGTANPLACVFSAALLLEHNGSPRGAAVLREAVGRALTDPTMRTADLGGQATTVELATAIAAQLDQVKATA